ncbi:hypothetical protein cyc_04701 [Cyclospora cayetanensis]|uniref:Uncharacterized protein n=1 Tax=Cyclospora cayetanensis TaxID=88456 RepID=A0A1D3D2U4_9EIME|nr:hypothetical protein cyc_04701 [Cyclospora cayetanensis]
MGVGAAAVSREGSAAATHQLVQLAQKLAHPGADDAEAAFAALLLLKGALQSGQQAASNAACRLAQGATPAGAAANNAGRAEILFVQALLVVLCKAQGPPASPRSFKVYLALMRRLARMTVAASPGATADRLSQALSQEALRKASSEFSLCKSVQGMCTCCVAPSMVQREVEELVAAEGILPSVLMQTVLTKLLIAVAGNAADALAYAQLLKQLLKELMTVRIGAQQMFRGLCKALLPWLQHPIASIAAQLARSMGSRSDSLRSWTVLLLLLLLFMRHFRIGFTGVADHHFALLLKLGEGSLQKLLLASVKHYESMSSSNSGDAEHDALVQALPLQLLAAALRGGIALLSENGCAHADQPQGQRTESAGVSLKGETELLRRAAASELKATFSALGGIPNLIQAIALSRLGATESEALEFLSRPEELYGGLVCFEEGGCLVRDALIALLQECMRNGLLGSGFILRLCNAVDCRLESVAGPPPTALAAALAAAAAPVNTPSFLNGVQQIDGLLALLAVSLQAAMHSGVFTLEYHEGHPRRLASQQHAAVAQLLGCEEDPAADNCLYTEQQMRQMLQQFGILLRLLSRFLTAGPFAGAVAVAALNKAEGRAAILAVAAARCCAVLKLLLQINPVMPVEDFREAVAFFFEQLLVPQPFMKQEMLYMMQQGRSAQSKLPVEQLLLQHQKTPQKLPYKELQRTLLLLLAQSDSREEQERQPLTDDFFDFSELPNYSDVEYLRCVLMGSTRNGSSCSGSGKLGGSEVYSQLLHQFKAYHNNEGLQLQLLAFLHGAVLLGRSEVPLHFSTGMPRYEAMPTGLLTAALQAAGWALGLGFNDKSQTVLDEPSGALQRSGLRLMIGTLRAADPLSSPHNQSVLLVQLALAAADSHLALSDPQLPLLLLFLLEAGAFCIAIRASSESAPELQHMVQPLLPLLYTCATTRLVQFLAAASAALVATASDVREQLLDVCSYATPDVQLNELLLRLASSMLSTKRAAYFSIVSVAFAALALSIVSRALSTVPCTATAAVHSSSTPRPPQDEDWKQGLNGLLERTVYLAKNCIYVLRCIAFGTALMYPVGPPVADWILGGPPAETLMGFPSPEAVQAWSTLLSAEGHEALQKQLAALSLASDAHH